MPAVRDQQELLVGWVDEGHTIQHPEAVGEYHCPRPRLVPPGERPSLSQRVAIRRNCFSLLKKRSTRLRSR